MKINYTLLISLFLWIQYQIAFSQTNTVFNHTKITLHARNKTIEQIFQIIQNKTSFHFNFSNRDIDKKLLVNLDYKAESINKILSDIAQIGHFKFLVFKNTISVAQNNKNEPSINLKY